MNGRPVAHKTADTLVYVLGGKGKVWQDGEVEEIAAGDCIAWIGGTGIAHALINDGEENDELALLEYTEVSQMFRRG